MNKQQLLETLHSIYDWPIEDENAWRVYNNILDLFNSGDFTTIDYLMDMIKTSKKERLEYRNSLAEIGYELRPDEVNQYIFLITVAMTQVEGEYV